MAAKIQKAIPGANVELVKGSRGAFVVIADGKKVWDKKAMGDEFPDEGQLVAAMQGGAS